MLNFKIQKKGIINTSEIKISSGQKVMVKGKNGHGKTVFLKMVTGLIFPDSGYMNFQNCKFNFPLSLRDSFKFMKFASKNIHYVDSINVFHNNFTIKQNFEFHFANNEYESYLLNDYLYEFEVNETINKFFKDLSKGTQQKLNVILALLSKKEIIVMDEPTLGFDNDTKSVFYNKVKESNRVIVISTHDSDYENYFDNIYFCELGELQEVKI